MVSEIGYMCRIDAKDADALGHAMPSAQEEREIPQTAFSEAKRSAVSQFERSYFLELVRATKGNVSEMARQSGMERHHVRAYLRKYGLDKTTG